jgi:phosphatidyl-myo-inositol dimannoside synthase
MRILFLTGSFPPPFGGGSVQYVYNIISHLPAYCAVVHTGSPKNSQSRDIDSQLSQTIVRSKYISTIMANPDSGRVLDRLIALREYLIRPFISLYICGKVRPDIIHICEVGFVGFGAIIARKLFGTPFTVFSYAEEITKLRIRWLHKWWLYTILRSANGHVVVSEYTKSLLLEAGVEDKNIFKIIPAVASTKSNTSNLEDCMALKKKMMLAGKRILLTVARLQERKNHLAVINSLPEIKKIYPNIYYIIAGTGQFEPILIAEVKRLGVEDNVTFMGYAEDSDIACLYNLCEIFVMPHIQIKDNMDTEGCPTVFLEASSHKKPVIGGNAGGVEDAIIDGLTGYIVDGNDVKILTRKILNLLDTPQLARQMGVSGQKYVRAFTPKNNASSIIEISNFISSIS